MSPEIITMIAIGIVMISIQMITFIHLLNRMDKISERMDSMQKDIGEVKAKSIAGSRRKSVSVSPVSKASSSGGWK